MEERQGMPYGASSGVQSTAVVVIGVLDTVAMDRAARIAGDDWSLRVGRLGLSLETGSVGRVQLGHPKADNHIMAGCDRRTRSRAIISRRLGMIEWYWYGVDAGQLERKAINRIKGGWAWRSWKQNK
jgi:hypothetical protein